MLNILGVFSCPLSACSHGIEDGSGTGDGDRVSVTEGDADLTLLQGAPVFESHEDSGFWEGGAGVSEWRSPQFEVAMNTGIWLYFFVLYGVCNLVIFLVFLLLGHFPQSTVQWKHKRDTKLQSHVK